MTQQQPESAISFHCPQCGRFCAIQAGYAGRRARCMHCNCLLIIPAQSGGEAQKAALVPQTPLEGFFRAALAGNLRTLFALPNLTGILFVIIAAVFPFFLGSIDLTVPAPGFHLLLPIGWISIVIGLGCRLWYYFEIIWASFLEIDTLPDIEIGIGFEFFGNLIRGIYLHLVALLLSVLPFMLLSAGLEKLMPVPSVLRPALLLPAALLYPMFLLLFAVDADWWKVFRLDQIVRTVIRFPKAYLLMALISFAALLSNALTIGVLDYKTNPSLYRIALLLTGKIGAALLTIFAMRTIGLFARHYARAVPLLWTEK